MLTPSEAAALLRGQILKRYVRAAIAGYRFQPDAKTVTGGRARDLELARIQRRYWDASRRLRFLHLLIRARIAVSYLPGRIGWLLVHAINWLGRRLDQLTGGVGIQV